MWHPEEQLTRVPPTCSQTTSCCFKVNSSPFMWPLSTHPTSVFAARFINMFEVDIAGHRAASESMPSPPNLPFIMLIWFPLMERFFKMASLYGFTYWLFNSWPSVLHHSCCAAAARMLPDQRRMLLECGIDFRAVFFIFFFFLFFFPVLCICVSVCPQLHPFLCESSWWCVCSLIRPEPKRKKKTQKNPPLQFHVAGAMSNLPLC